MNSKKTAYLSVLTCISLAIFALEAQLPPFVPVPGIKLGLANIITLIIIVRFGKRDAFTVLCIRMILSSVFSGTLMGFLYSAAGGIMSFLTVCLALRLLGRERLWAVSVFGAMAHNTAQIAVAAALTGTVQVFWYLPFLILSGVLTGVFTGLCAGIALKYLK